MKDVDWERYKTFLYTFWETISLQQSGSEGASEGRECSATASKAPSCPDVPFALDLLARTDNPQSGAWSPDGDTGARSRDAPRPENPSPRRAKLRSEDAGGGHSPSRPSEGRMEVGSGPPLLSKSKRPFGAFVGKGGLAERSSRIPFEGKAAPGEDPSLRRLSCVLHGCPESRHESRTTPGESEGAPRASEVIPRASEVTLRALEETPRASELTVKESGGAMRKSEETVSESGETMRKSGAVSRGATDAGGATEVARPSGAAAKGGSCVHRKEIEKLEKELEEAQKRMMYVAFKMDDQSTQLQRLIDDHSRLSSAPFHSFAPLDHFPQMNYNPVLPHQGFKAPHHNMFQPPINHYGYSAHPSLGRRASWQYPCDSEPRGRLGMAPQSPPDELMSRLAGGAPGGPGALESLRDRIVALQMQNMELSLFLRKEEARRREAEEAVRREKQYVQKLHDSLHDLSTSTLVMDPLTYKQVADKYIAARKKPVRRTHTCSPYIGPSDLVCDTKRLHNQNENSDSRTAETFGDKSRAVPNSNQALPDSLTDGGLTSRDAQSRGAVSEDEESWKATQKNSLSAHEYRDLLRSLDGLEVASSPP